jgi:glycosyltransferase involved in cell wall biosynthesis
MVKMGDRCVVHVEYMVDPRQTAAWDAMAFNYGKASEAIQEKLYAAFKYFDVIVFQRIQNKEALALIAKLKEDNDHVKIVAEIDDSIGEVPLSSTLPWKKHHMWAAEHLFRSDAVICSTEYLGNSIKKIIGDKPVYVAPNCISKDTWNPKLTDKINDRFRIGYIGGASHDEDLRIVYRGLKPILDTQDDFELVIRYGGFKPEWLEDHPLIDFERVDCHISKYPQLLADLSLDIGIAPLRDSEFNRCKSNIKFLEMASIGVPLVASNVEPYKNTKGDIVLVENDPTKFAQAILDRLSKTTNVKVDRDKARKKLRTNMFRNYNMKHETVKLLDFFEGLKDGQTYNEDEDEYEPDSFFED